MTLRASCLALIPVVQSLLLFSLIVSGVIRASIAHASSLETPFANLSEIALALNIDAYQNAQPSGRRVKIAVLDNGFRGHAAEIGRTLPANTVYRAGPVAVEAEAEEAHGLFMAQLVAGLLDRAAKGAVPYELHLFSAFGYSNLKQAVQTAIAEKFDVILYAQVWEYGGNGDGGGFINKLATEATDAGVIWVNASGNFGDSTYIAPIERAEDDWARLPGPNQSVQIRCLKNESGKCKFRSVMSWNDFNDDVAIGSDKDLDFVLTDDALKVIRTSTLQQKKEFPEGQPGLSLYPREIIEAELTPGLYYLRAKIRSQNFSKDKDKLRIVTSGDHIQQINVTAPEETLLAPADNPSVITVGATDTPKSAQGRSMGKPELTFPSLVTLENGENYKGSSNSSAVAAAAVVLLKAINPELDRDGVLSLLAQSGQSSGPTGPVGSSLGQGLPLEILGFGPTGLLCFKTARLPMLLKPVVPLLQNGAVTVMTTAGIKIFTAVDPFTLVPNARRTRMDDMLVVNANGFQVLPRVAQWQLGNEAFEVLQFPQDQLTCEFGAFGMSHPTSMPFSRNPSTSSVIPDAPTGQTLRLPEPRNL